PHWWSPDTVRALRKLRYPEREVTASLGSGVDTNVAMERERTLAAGSVVVFSSEGGWVSMLWNNRFSNRVEYGPSGPDFLKKAEALDPTWLFISPSDPAAAQLDSGWEELGKLYPDLGAIVYRRVPRAPSSVASDPR